jgi:hypothetical protein
VSLHGDVEAFSIGCNLCTKVPGFGEGEEMVQDFLSDMCGVAPALDPVSSPPLKEMHDAIAIICWHQHTCPQ